MDGDQSLNPYSYTEAPPAVGDEPAQPLTRVPPGLIVLGILFLLLGGWGLLSGLFGMLALILQVVAPSAEFVGAGPEMEMQREFQSQMDSVNNRLLPFSSVNIAGNFLLSVAMVVGAIALFVRKEWGRVLTLRVIVACAIFTLLEIGLAAAAMYFQTSIMVNFFEATTAGGPLGSSAGNFIYIGIGLGIAMLVVMYGIEYGIYVFGYRYLQRPEIRALFT
ncbi:MAG TPA: hypothetical protein VGN57_20755 [Pirellulaceae bacterium]|jgi:hypothetical protein|nr:hypothetical protein [Pirellulaceae bacterium]